MKCLCNEASLYNGSWTGDGCVQTGSLLDAVFVSFISIPCRGRVFTDRNSDLVLMDLLSQNAAVLYGIYT